MSSPDDDPDSSSAACAAPPGVGRAAVVLLIDLEPALAALLGEWLAGTGVQTRALRAADVPGLNAAVDLIVVDIPFPRQGASPALQQLARARPGTPILALSSTFFTGVAAGGEVARQLGVAAVLAAPVGREAWLAAVARLLEPRR